MNKYNKIKEFIYILYIDFGIMVDVTFKESDKKGYIDIYVGDLHVLYFDEDITTVIELLSRIEDSQLSFKDFFNQFWGKIKEV